MANPLLLSLFDEVERRPLTVSELTMQVRGALENRFASVWVEGEISNFKAHASGHWYFTIKDEAAQLRATCFRGVNGRIRFRPSDGLHVRARGRLSVYEPRGEYELVIEALDPVGAGALRVAFEQMRDRLAAEGLFAEELKRPLPIFPRRIGIVTSPSGAALRDMLNVLARRTRTVDMLLAPARVQGTGASLEIISAIKLLNEYHARAIEEGRADDMVDVIIIGRGGGSAEDLWAFNDEGLARTIRASQIPVISAIGHETDFTIADFASDLRAPTPSAAAEMVAAREDEIAAYVETLTRAALTAMRFQLMEARAHVQEAAMSQGFDQARTQLSDTRSHAEDLAHRLEIVIGRNMQRARRRADATSCRLQPARLGAHVSAARTRYAVLCAARDAAVAARVEEARARLGVCAASLDALSPLAVLKRGYALAQDERGHLLRSAGQVSVGDEVRLRLSEGTLRCRVEGSEDA